MKSGSVATYVECLRLPMCEISGLYYDHIIISVAKVWLWNHTYKTLILCTALES